MCFTPAAAPAPILDLRLFKYATFRASIFGGFMFRLGIGALPFLLPLLLQIGFKLTPFQSGLITFTGALGSIFMKAAVAGVLKRFGYRNVLVYNSLISAAFLAACAELPPRHAVCRDDRHPARRRLLPLAAIHRRQHHRLCRDRAGADEPGDHDRLRRPATGAVHRRRRRCACRRDHAADQARPGDGRRRFSAGLSRGRRADRRGAAWSSCGCRTTPAPNSPAAMPCEPAEQKSLPSRSSA